MSSYFDTSLRSMAAYVGRPTDFGSSYDFGSPGLGLDGGGGGIDSFGLGSSGLSQQMFGGGGLQSRNFLRFGTAAQIYNGVLGGVPTSGPQMPDYVGAMIGGGIGAFGPGGRPFIGAPVTGQMWNPVGQVPYQGGDGGSAGGVHASGGLDDADEEDDELTTEMTDAAATKLAGSEHGYSADEAKDIVAKMKEASGGSKARFDEMMKAFEELPARTPPQEDLEKAESPDAKQALKDKYEAAWQRQYGEWYARHIGKLSDAQAADFVDHAAFEPGGATGTKSGKVSVVRDKGPGTGLRYRVTTAEPGSGLKTGDFVFFTGGKWYRDTGASNEITGTSLPTAKGKAGEKFENIVVNAPKTDDATPPADDFVDVRRVGRESITIDGTARTLEAYTFTKPKTPGEKAAALTDGAKLYYDRWAGKWYQGPSPAPSDGTVPAVTLIDPQPKLGPDGRLVFKAAPRGKPALFLADDSASYNRFLDQELKLYRAGLEATEADRKKNVEESVEGFKKTFGSDDFSWARDVVDVAYVGDEIRLTVKEGKEGDAATRFGKLGPKGQALFRDLAPGVKVTLNGAVINTRSSDLPRDFARAIEVTKRPALEPDPADAPKPLEVKDPIAGADEAAFKADLKKKVEAALAAAKAAGQDPKSVVLEGTVTRPAGMDDAKFKGVCNTVAAELSLPADSITVKPPPPAVPLEVSVTAAELDGKDDKAVLTRKVREALTGKDPKPEKLIIKVDGQVTAEKKVALEALLNDVATANTLTAGAVTLRAEVKEAPEPEADRVVVEGVGPSISSDTYASMTNEQATTYLVQLVRAALAGGAATNAVVTIKIPKDAKTKDGKKLEDLAAEIRKDTGVKELIFESVNPSPPPAETVPTAGGEERAPPPEAPKDARADVPSPPEAPAKPVAREDTVPPSPPGPLPPPLKPAPAESPRPTVVAYTPEQKRKLSALLAAARTAGADLSTLESSGGAKNSDGVIEAWQRGTGGNPPVAFDEAQKRAAKALSAALQEGQRRLQAEGAALAVAGREGFKKRSDDFVRRCERHNQRVALLARSDPESAKSLSVDGKGLSATAFAALPPLPAKPPPPGYPKPQRDKIHALLATAKAAGGDLSKLDPSGAKNPDDILKAWQRNSEGHPAVAFDDAVQRAKGALATALLAEQQKLQAEGAALAAAGRDGFKKRSDDFVRRCEKHNRRVALLARSDPESAKSLGVDGNALSAAAFAALPPLPAKPSPPPPGYPKAQRDKIHALLATAKAAGGDLSKLDPSGAKNPDDILKAWQRNSEGHPAVAFDDAVQRAKGALATALLAEQQKLQAEGAALAAAGRKGFEKRSDDFVRRCERHNQRVKLLASVDSAAAASLGVDGNALSAVAFAALPPLPPKPPPPPPGYPKAQRDKIHALLATAKAADADLSTLDPSGAKNPDDILKAWQRNTDGHPAVAFDDAVQRAKGALATALLAEQQKLQAEGTKLAEAGRDGFKKRSDDFVRRCEKHNQRVKLLASVDPAAAASLGVDGKGLSETALAKLPPLPPPGYPKPQREKIRALLATAKAAGGDLSTLASSGGANDPDGVLKAWQRSAPPVPPEEAIRRATQALAAALEKEKRQLEEEGQQLAKVKGRRDFDAVSASFLGKCKKHNQRVALLSSYDPRAASSLKVDGEKMSRTALAALEKPAPPPPAPGPEVAPGPTPPPERPWSYSHAVKDASGGTVANVDMSLPAEFDAELQKALPEIVRKAKTQEDVVRGVAEWLLKRTEGWGTLGTEEDLSVPSIIRKQRGSCTERTALLYTVVQRAKQLLRGQKVNLDGTHFAFAQVFDYHEAHVCMTASSDGKLMYVDIAGDAANSGVIADYKKTIILERDGFTAEMLTNRASERKQELEGMRTVSNPYPITNGGEEPDAMLLALCLEAERMRGKNTFVAIQVAHLYNAIAREFNQKYKTSGFGQLWSSADDRRDEYLRKVKFLYQAAQRLPFYSATRDPDLHKQIAALSS